jgi:arylsulfatase A-like enzyme
LFILADDLGYSDTTLYGTTWFYETPNIERLASRGMRFRNAYAASPICSATRASILTGQEPGRLGLTGAGGHLEKNITRAHFRTPSARAARPKSMQRKAIIAVSATRLDTDVETLADTLQRNGYATGHFGKWHLGPEPFSPLEQGFDVDLPHGSGPGPAGSYIAPWQFPAELRFKAAAPREHIEDRMVREAVAFMEQHKQEPFFLNYWSYSVHSPFEAKPEWVQKYKARVHSSNPQRSPVYAGMIQSFDEAVGALLDALDRLELNERTIVVFFSDNGGSTYDRIQGVPATSNAPLRGGKGQIYEGGIRVPAVVIWPGRIEPGSRSKALLSSTDWYPTLLEMLEIEKPREHLVDGVSQVSALLGNESPRSSIYSYLPHYFPLPGTVPATSLRKGDWKLIRFHHDAPDQSDRFELYDLASDLAERHNLADAHPDRVLRMDREIADYLREIGALVPMRNPAYTPAAVSPRRPPAQDASSLDASSSTGLPNPNRSRRSRPQSR